MLLSSLPLVLLSSVALNVDLSLALQAPKQNPLQKLASKVTGGVVGGPDAPPDLHQYQTAQAAKLKSRCHDQREKALALPSLPAEVTAYANNKSPPGGFKAMSGMGVKGFKMTPFTHYHDTPNIMHTSHGCHVIMNGKSPFIRSYKPDKQSEAGQSFLHFLVIPVPNVYNGAVLPDDTWVKKSKAAFAAFLAQPTWHHKATRRVWHYISTKVDNFDKKKDRADFEALSKQAKGLKEKDFVYAYHVGVDASVPHLHMHVIAAPAPMRALSSSKHDEKDVPPETLLAEIAAHPLKTYKGWDANAIAAANGKKGGGGGGKKVLGKRPRNHKRSGDAAFSRRDVAAARAAFRMTE